MFFRYRFESLGDDVFELFEDGVFLLTFSRLGFRSFFEKFANENHRSSNWIGTILRLFLEKYPAPSPGSKRNEADRLLVRYGEQFLVDYIKSKGYSIKLRLDISDCEVIQLLEGRGYVVGTDL